MTTLQCSSGWDSSPGNVQMEQYPWSLTCYYSFDITCDSTHADVNRKKILFCSSLLKFQNWYSYLRPPEITLVHFHGEPQEINVTICMTRKSTFVNFYLP